LEASEHYTLREAKFFDTENVLELYRLLCQSQKSEIRTGPKTDLWIQGLLEQALSGLGVCLVAEVSNYLIGATLAVKAEFPYDTDGKKTAIGYGTFVRRGFRRYGVANKLYSTLKAQLIERGYDLYIGAYLKDNLEVVSAIKRAKLEPFQIGVRWNLEKE